MATRYVTLEGIATWAKVFEHNRDLEGYKGAYQDTNGRTTINLTMDQGDYEKLQSSKSMKRGKPDPDTGGMTVKFDRKWETGQDWNSGPPEIIRPDGNPWVFETDGFIGNGSTVRVQLVVADIPAQGVVSTRLEKVKVLEHVVYENANDDFYKDDTGSYKPASTPPATTPPSPKVEDNDEDEIPF